MGSFKDIILGTAGIPATVAITSDESEFTDATPFEIQIEFNKAVTGFVVGDITITNATLSNFAGSSTSYTADVTPDLSGDISISVGADVTNEGNTASNIVTVTNAIVYPEGWDASSNTNVAVSGVGDIDITKATGGSSIHYIFGARSREITGSWYFEVQVINGSSTGFYAGLSWSLSSTATTANSIVVKNNGAIFVNNSSIGKSVSNLPGLGSYLIVVKNKNVYIGACDQYGGSATFNLSQDPDSNTNPVYVIPSSNNIRPLASVYNQSSTSQLHAKTSNIKVGPYGATPWDD